MSISRREETGRFHAKGSDGRTYLVIVTLDFINTTTIHVDVKSDTPGAERYWLSTGPEVWKVDGELIVSTTGVKLERI